MQCPGCGHANDDNARTCIACGRIVQPYGAAVPANMATPMPSADIVRQVEYPHVANHMAWAVLATVLVCLPAGIVAIVYASQVNPKMAAGDVAGARASAHKAAVWCWGSLAISTTLAIVFTLAIVMSLTSYT